jgi:signal transduction histidine kinase
MINPKARLLNWYRKMGLRAKVTLGILLPLLLILGVFTAIEYTRHRNAVLNNLSLLASNSGKLIENTLRKEMLVSNFTKVQELMDTIGDTEDFRVLYLLNTSGEVIFAPRGENVGARLDNNHPSCQPCHELPAASRPASVVVTAENGQRVFRSMQPIENSPECAECHDPTDRLIGILLTDIPTSPMEATLSDDLRENLIWGVSTIAATILIVNLVLSEVVLRRLEKLGGILDRFGQGALHLRFPTRSRDEIGQLTAAFNQMGQRIESEVAENQALSEHLHRQNAIRGDLLKRLITAQEDERRRVARELHDDFGQALSALSLHSELAEKFSTTDMSRTLEQLNQIQALVADTTDRMYELILALRPSALDDLGLESALRALADQVLSNTGIAFQLNARGLGPRLPPEFETALYRIFQEALSNVIRHSNASQVNITLSRDNGILTGEITDNGRGFNPEEVSASGTRPSGLGLVGMQERVVQYGGKIDISSRFGKGTRISIQLPLGEADVG